MAYISSSYEALVYKEKLHRGWKTAVTNRTCTVKLQGERYVTRTVPLSRSDILSDVIKHGSNAHC